MRRIVALTAAAVAAATMTATAGAALPASARTLMAHRETITPSRQLVLASLTVKHAKDVLGFLRANPAVGTALSRFRVRLDHEWLLRFGLHARARALADIAAASRPAHYDGWMCIHSGEGAWDDNTGNGYYGGLQAHYDWYGVARMDLLSPIDQIRHAESVAAANGFSYSFMVHQWPNTFPPCAGFF